MGQRSGEIGGNGQGKVKEEREEKEYYSRAYSIV